jgi:hypothetical protein
VSKDSIGCMKNFWVENYTGPKRFLTQPKRSCLTSHKYVSSFVRERDQRTNRRRRRLRFLRISSATHHEWIHDDGGGWLWVRLGPGLLFTQRWLLLSATVGDGQKKKILQRSISRCFWTRHEETVFSKCSWQPGTREVDARIPESWNEDRSSRN